MWRTEKNKGSQKSASECLRGTVFLSEPISFNALRICAIYKAKNSRIWNFWTFWPVIQLITHHEDISLSTGRFLHSDLIIEKMCSSRGPLIDTWCSFELYIHGGNDVRWFISLEAQGAHMCHIEMQIKFMKKWENQQLMRSVWVRAVYSDIAYVKCTIYIHWSRCGHLAWPVSWVIMD